MENRITEIRKSKKIKRVDLAKKSGVPLATIRSIEMGTNNIYKVQFGTLLKIALALECNIKDLFIDILEPMKK